VLVSFEEAMQLILSKRVDMLNVLTKTVTLEDVPRTIVDIEKKPEKYMKVVVNI